MKLLSSFLMGALSGVGFVLAVAVVLLLVLDRLAWGRWLWDR